MTLTRGFDNSMYFGGWLWLFNISDWFQPNFHTTRTYIPHIDAKRGTGLKKSTPPPVVAVVTNMNYAYLCTYDQGEINCGASWEPDFNSESFPPKASGICSTFLLIVVNAVNQASWGKRYIIGSPLYLLLALLDSFWALFGPRQLI